MLRHVILAGMVAVSLPALADSNHYNNMLIGDRASGMAGAYAAVSDDPSGLYYNPAGIVYSGSKNFSASVNAYHTSSVRYKNVINGQDWERTSSSLLPNFFAVIQPFGKGLMGFSYAVTDSVIEDQDFSTIVNNNKFVMNLNYRDVTNKVGPSYAYSVSDNFSVGATLYAHFRTTKLIANQLVQSLSTTAFQLNNTYNEADEFGIEPVLGVMWSPAERISIGASLRKVTILDSTWGVQTITANDSTIPIINFPTDANGTGDDYRNLPVESRLGIAYFPSNRLLLSADIMHFSATSASGPAYPAKEATLNYALGVEYYPKSTWAVRAGYYTNRSNTPELSSFKTNQEDHVNLSGITLSITHLTRTSSLTGGIGYSAGNGQSQPYSDNQLRDVEATAFTAYLSSSYTY